MTKEEVSELLLKLFCKYGDPGRCKSGEELEEWINDNL